MLPLAAFIDLPAFLLVIVANSTPVGVAKLLGKRCAVPIDAGLVLRDGRPLFGSHKTWRGLVTGTVATGLVGSLLEVGFATGALFGSLALLGDLLSSFFKRRLNRASGRWTPLLDQVPEALLPMLLLQSSMNLTAVSMLGTITLFTLLDLVFSKWLNTQL